MIKKDLFIKSLENLQKQNLIDRQNSELVREAFGINESFIYDTSLLQNSILDLLSVWFDREELAHYCYVLDFGRIGESVETFEELYDRLTSNLDFCKCKIGKPSLINSENGIFAYCLKCKKKYKPKTNK